jgi:uncharacterized protein (TIGR00369 family)
VSADHTATIPAGFEPVAMGGPFVAANGPFYVQQQDGRFKLGLRIERRHCNTMGHCHGGLLMTFADMMMPLAMYDNHPELAEVKRFLPTVGLQIDFIGAIHAGDWLEGEAQVLKVTRSIVFAQGLVHAHGQLVLRCSGTYKVASQIPPGHPGMYTDQAPPALPRRERRER